MRILVIRLSSIGDIILTTPFLKALKEKYPKIKIDFLVMDKFKDAIDGCEYVDRVICFDKNKNDGLKNIYKFAEELRNENYDYVVDLHSKFRSIMISNFIGVKVFRYKKRQFWKTLLVKMRIIKYHADDTIIKNYFNSLKSENLVYNGEVLNFVFDKTNLEKIKDYKGYIVLAPGASKNTKKWTAKNFGELALKLSKKNNSKILIVGDKGDYEVAEQINKFSVDSCINLCGKTTLKELGALLSQSKFLVANDSSAFHIGRGVGCKSFVIFGPTDPNMFEFGQKEILITLGEKCSPCSLHGDKECPKKHFNCMNNLTAEKVYDIIEKNL